jgi:hypothetical protein
MTRNDGLHIGTPQQLAQSGALTQFIERSQGITFDKSTLSVRIQGPLQKE